MKKFIFLFFLLNLFFITASYAEESAFCCSYITVSSEVTEMCCVRLSVNNPHCYDPTIVFKRYNTTTGQYVTISSQSIGQGQTATQIICPIQGENFVQYRILIQQYNGGPYCPQYSDSLQNPWSFKEGYTQFTGTVDLSNCCKCPATKNSWLNYIIQKDRTCPNDGCIVVITGLNIPEDITCYNSYVIGYPNQTMSPLRNLVNHPIAGTSFCIGNNSSADYSIYLIKGTSYQLDSACVITTHVSCDSTVYNPDDSSQICLLDCPEIHYQGAPDSKTYTLQPSGCIIKIFYQFRIACAPTYYQDLVIKKLIKLNNCTGITDQEIFQQTTKALIDEDPMGFFPNPDESGCSDQWRITIKSCWKTSFEWDFLTQSYHFVLYPCEDTACCIQKYRVCRAPLTVVKLGSTFMTDTSHCVNMPPPVIGDPASPYQFICHTTCEWLDIEIGNPSPPSINQNSFGEFPEFVNFNKNYQITNEDKIKLEIYSVWGFPVCTKEFQNNEKLNNFNIYSLIQNDGLYIYKIYSNGIIIKTGKIIK